ncbi:MAG: hypothetical protein PHD01_12830 [Geobacteraceae bacterium]|nr:hypothetical protein [Geobacteraceae bacterium]
MRRLWLVVPLLGLTGCSVFTENAPFPLKETNQSDVKACRKVAKLPGPSGYRMWGPPAALGSFKYDAAKKAKEMGATHIYWGEDVEGIEGGIVGYAVDCTGVPVGRDENGISE